MNPKKISFIFALLLATGVSLPSFVRAQDQNQDTSGTTPAYQTDSGTSSATDTNTGTAGMNSPNTNNVNRDNPSETTGTMNNTNNPSTTNPATTTGTTPADASSMAAANQMHHGPSGFLIALLIIVIGAIAFFSMRRSYRMRHQHA